MEYSEFVTKIKEPNFQWGVKGFYRPVYLVWGPLRSLPIALFALAILGLGVGFAVYSFYIGKPLSAIWIIPSLFAFFAPIPSLNCISGIPYGIFAIIGLILALFLGSHHLFAGLIPGITWLAMGVLKGTTMVGIGDELVKSKDLYDRLRTDGTLFFKGA